ncbi:DUF1064 domain-containing protein [Paenibacillus harenae]|uniref:DUF1064 domain-containing protein n=1 Tax=Paenibacillus harenae TaxID=306543 RepID=A0ABT9U5G8_PAEHA|nr:DUF1064 domain-containing protein [Paenibacillus harenae]MDQ0114311.1 hypothetical protein [Paenibacillus harenae]
MRFGKKKVTEGEESRTKYNAKKALLNLETESVVEISNQQVKNLRERGLDPDRLIIFDSKLEAKYYLEELLPLVREQSVIVELQPKFTLVPKFEKDGMKHQAVTYSPDFKVTYFTGKVLLIDVKGTEDQKFPIKRKLFDYNFPQFPPLVVMKYVKKFGGWITFEEYTLKKREENKQKKAAAN